MEIARMETRRIPFVFLFIFISPLSFDAKLHISIKLLFHQSDYSRNSWDAIFGTQIPLPWEHFKQELLIRMSPDPKGFLSTHIKESLEIGYPDALYETIHPIFVSRMPNHKVTGSAHDETIRSAKYYHANETLGIRGGAVISKVALSDLKLDRNGEIENYFNKESDTLLYEALKKRLKDFNGKGAEAFKEVFYKPKKDGTPGPIVKKVKRIETMSSGVEVNSGKGIANNGKMIRTDVFLQNGKYYSSALFKSTRRIFAGTLSPLILILERYLIDWNKTLFRLSILSLNSSRLPLYTPSVLSIRTGLST